MLVACHSTSSGGGTPTTSASAPVTVVSAPMVTASTTNTARPTPSAGAPILSPEERRQENKYQAALARGRLAMQHKDFDAAERAFGEAIAAHPHDARALGERGYERLQVNRLDEASHDFNEADTGAAPPEIAAQIYFNQGLVAERMGDLATAKIAFARSQAAHASDAAAQKLAALHASRCTVATLALNQPAQHFASWVEFWKTCEDGSEVLTSDDEVKERLGVKDCDDYCIAGFRDWHLVFPSATGLDVIRRLDRGWGTSCSGPPQFELERQGDFLRVTSTNIISIRAVSDPCEPDNCRSFCTDGPEHHSDTFIDLKARRAVLRVSQYGPLSEKFEALPVTFKSNSVTVTGNGCDRTIPLVPSTK